MATISQGVSLSRKDISSVLAGANLLSTRHPTPPSIRRSGVFLPKQKPVLRVMCFATANARHGVGNLPSLYALLGLEQNVQHSAIKSAYRQLARKYHPDVCPVENREECTRLFLQVQDAYETLSDPARRAAYDNALRRGFSGSGASWDKGLHKRWAGVESSTEEWKPQWEAQLNDLGKRSTDNMSWGARMRAKRQSQQSE